MGPDPAGRPCRLAELDTTLIAGSTNRPLVSPLALRPLLSCFPRSLLLSLASPSRYRAATTSSSSFSPRFSSTSCSSLVPVCLRCRTDRSAISVSSCSTLAGIRLSSVTRRRLSRHCREQIGRPISSRLNVIARLINASVEAWIENSERIYTRDVKKYYIKKI